MRTTLSAILLIVATIILFSMAATSLAEANSDIYKNWRGIAISGYDPVAFYKDGKPVEGSNKYELKWRDAKWRFVSAEHRDLLKANPEKYAPQYSGYCAWAVSQRTTAGVDPKNA